jgi:hypothetical protein
MNFILRSIQTKLNGSSLSLNFSRDSLTKCDVQSTDTCFTLKWSSFIVGAFRAPEIRQLE